MKRGHSALLQRIRSVCTALPEAKEEIKWGHPVFVAGKKLFAGFGEQDGVPTLGFKVPADKFDPMVDSGRFFPTPYAARFNWVSLYLREPIDWDEVKSLLIGSYRLVALKRMVKQLDGAD